MINSVKITFYPFSHELQPKVIFEKNIRIPDLIDLAAMKAYALEGLAKWKDYIDLFFFIKNHFSLANISKKAQQLFNDFFYRKTYSRTIRLLRRHGLQLTGYLFMRTRAGRRNNKFSHTADTRTFLAKHHVSQ